MINLLVVLLKEVVAHSGLYLSHADRPLMKTKFFFDRAHVIDVGALPVTLHVVQEGVLGPSTTVLSEKSCQVLELGGVQLSGQSGRSWHGKTRLRDRFLPHE